MKHSIEDMFRYYRYFIRHPNSKIIKQNGGLFEFLKDFCNRTLGEHSSSMGLNENNTLSRQVRKRVTKDINYFDEAKRKK